MDRFVVDCEVEEKQAVEEALRRYLGIDSLEALRLELDEGHFYTRAFGDGTIYTMPLQYPAGKELVFQTYTENEHGPMHVHAVLMDAMPEQNRLKALAELKGKPHQESLYVFRFLVGCDRDDEAYELNPTLVIDGDRGETTVFDGIRPLENGLKTVAEWFIRMNIELFVRGWSEAHAADGLSHDIDFMPYGGSQVMHSVPQLIVDAAAQGRCDGGFVLSLICDEEAEALEEAHRLT